MIIFLLIVAVNETLILSLPLGTVGERITFTKKPFFLKKDCNSKHFVSSPNIIGIICEFEEPVFMSILFNSFIRNLEFSRSFFLEFSMSIIEFYSYEDKVFALQERLSNKAGFIFWIATLFLAGFTPLPYKVFTITSGFIGFNLYLFIIISFISRGLRFFIVSFLTMKFGNKFEEFLDKAGFKFFSITGIIIVIAALTLYFYLK